jgi:hypothetical protein
VAPGGGADIAASIEKFDAKPAKASGTLRSSDDLRHGQRARRLSELRVTRGVCDQCYGRRTDS